MDDQLWHGEGNELQMAAMATLDGSLVEYDGDFGDLVEYDGDFVAIAESRLVTRLPQFGHR